MIPDGWLVPALAALVVATIPPYAWATRGRGYATYGLVILAISFPGLLISHARLREWATALPAPWFDVLFAWGILAAGLHLGALVRARLRSTPFRWGISIPGMTTVAAGAMAGAWLLALLPMRGLVGLLGWTGASEVLAWLDLVPFAIAGGSVLTSMRSVEEIVRFSLDDDDAAPMRRIPVERIRRREPAPLEKRRLRIVQIADPHLGPWQPVARLRREIDSLVSRDPDLVLLTGDFLTMEGAGTPGALGEALAPLLRLPGRCFAIFGNHDHESPDEVRRALAANGVTLLLDDEVVLATAVGPVQIVGADYVGKGRGRHIAQLLARFPRRPGHLRLLLLHDPSAFKHVPVGDADLTLSGHTHGGQLGLVSFGLDWTILSRSSWPDHGLFGHGTNRLYVHRGTGFYGFPLRIGVPAELSVLELALQE